MKLIDPINDLAEYCNVSVEALKAMLPYGEKILRAIWDVTLSPHTEFAVYDQVAVDNYYLNPVVQNAYMLAMTEVWTRPYRWSALDGYVSWLTKMTPRDGSVLDYGAGTGEILLNLVRARPDVMATYADYLGVHDRYVRWRAHKIARSLTLVDFSMVIGRKYDVVICTSTLEHDAEIEITTRKLVDLLKPGGYGLFEVDWVYNADQPMHLPVTASWRDKWQTELMPSLGMRHLGGAFWQKEVAGG